MAPYLLCLRPDQLNLTPLTEGLITSSLLLGAAFGAMFGGKLSDRYGRRKMILYLAILFFFTTLGCTFSKNANMMIFFRFLLGLAVGGASSMVPTFLAEMAPSERRSRMVTQNELMIVSGQLLAYVFNAVIGNIGENANVWRYMMVIATIPAILLWFGMLAVPESPRWLASKGKMGTALRVLRQIREEKRAASELNEIKQSIKQESSIKQASFKDLSIPWIRKIVYLGIGLAVVQQITGVNSIMYYGTEILKESGLGTKAALVANIANGMISVIATCVGIWLLGKVPHKPMLITGLIGTTSSLLLIGISSAFLEGYTAFPYIVLTLTVTFLAFQQGAIGPVTWLMLSEIFPLKLRGIGMGVSVFCLWITNFIISLTFPTLLSNLGLSVTFLIFTIFGLAAIKFVKKFVPETQGETLEELEYRFRTKGNNKSYLHTLKEAK